MRFEDTALPWTGKRVRKIDDLRTRLADRLEQGMCDYLPRSITLFVDPEVEESAVHSFLGDMVSWLKDELQRRRVRRDIFVKLGLFTPREIESFLTARTHTQAWAIYYSRAGGLGIPAGENPSAVSADRGVVPCFSMRNHGVAWAQGDAGLQVWLATARKEGQAWDWDSDIGHESAHAAFAQVPLFTQLLAQAIDAASLSSLGSARDLGPAHIARMAYFYSEIAVVALRGENRPTESGLPVAESAELRSLLELSDDLAPAAGFHRARMALDRTQGRVDLNCGNEIYEIAAPVMKAIPRLTGFVNLCDPPDLAALRRALAG